ncbi:MAG: inositol monophosphatase family protein [Gemmatales bacterium]|nr:3'(2'),5'-bisphosphate nucleotidase CysQ [Gemmatales bacterium]MDW8174572.1 inositol monophosphatase family protein [Gemmatales bacterium]
MATWQDLAVARQAAEAAAEIILVHYQSMEAVEWAPPEVTTVADRVAQDCILEYLAQHFPHDAFYAEEKTPVLTRLRHQGERLWIVDPIDGTRGFVLKNGEFAILIGLVEHGEAVLGLVLEPAEQRSTWALRGQGCWTSRAGADSAQRCAVSTTAELSRARLVRSRGDRGSSAKSLLPVAEEVSCYSAGRKLAMLARGEVDIYASLYPGFHVWDVCAGEVLVCEAGGVFTDACGQPVRYSEPHRPVHGILAANPNLYDQALSLLKPRMMARLGAQK